MNQMIADGVILNAPQTDQSDFTHPGFSGFEFCQPEESAQQIRNLISLIRREFQADEAERFFGGHLSPEVRMIDRHKGRLLCLPQQRGNGFILDDGSRPQRFDQCDVAVIPARDRFFQAQTLQFFVENDQACFASSRPL